MTVRPTRAVLVPLVAAIVLFALAKLAGGAWLALACAATVVVPLVALLLPPRLAGLVAERSGADRVVVGSEVEQVLTVRNEGVRTTSPFRLADDAAGLAPVTVAVPTLRPGAAATVHLVRTATRRGVYDDATGTATSTFPFGMLRATAGVPLRGRLVVHPQVSPVARVPGAATDGPGEVPVDAPGVGTEVLGLREWRSGDSARAVSARASARHGRPLVLERERETGSALVLLAAGPGRGRSWERAVSQGASLALAALREGTPPLLLGAPPPARPDRNGVLDWFAGVDRVRGLDSAEVDRALRAARGGTLVLLAPTALLVDRMDLRRACDAHRADLVVLDG